MAKPKPERTPNSAAKTNHSNKPSVPGDFGQAEPLPEWDTAIVEWGAAWEAHAYGFGLLFLCVALKGLYSALRLKRVRNSRQRKVHLVNFSLLILFGVTRALVLLVDAYHSTNMLPGAVVTVVWGVGHPCIVTAYTLMFVVLKNALVMKQRFQNWYTTRNIALVTVPYFTFVFFAELTVGSIPSLQSLTFVCQMLYALSISLLLVFYSFIVLLLWKKRRRIISGTDDACLKKHGARLKAVLVTCCAAILGGVSLCITQGYAMLGVYGVFSDTNVVSPWPWYGFNTGQRTLELYMGVLLLWFLSYKPNIADNDVQPISVADDRKSCAGELGHHSVVVQRDVTTGHVAAAREFHLPEVE